MMNDRIRDRLSQIAEMLDPGHLARSEKLQEDAIAYRKIERIPVILAKEILPDHPLYPVDEAFHDPDKMFWNELHLPYMGVKLKDDRILTVRASYGPILITAMLGCEYYVDHSTTWAKPLKDSGAIRKLIDRGIPDFTSGLAARVLETQALFKGYLEDCGLSPYIHLFQADNQGPFDCADMIWGEGIYYAMYDEPELVHELLDLVTQTTVSFVKAQKKVMGEKNGMYHWWWKIPGGVRAVDDMTTVLSPATYEAFSKPYTEKLYAEFGGGYMHYCGHTLQNQALRLATKGLRAVDMGGREIAEDLESHKDEYTIQKLCDQAAEHRVAILFGATGLPAERPSVSTGLVYAEVNKAGRSFEQGAEHLKAAKEYWVHK